MTEAHHIVKARIIADLISTTIKYAIELHESRHLFEDRQQTQVRLLNNSLSTTGYQVAELLRLIRNEQHDAEEQEHINATTSATTHGA